MDTIKKFGKKAWGFVKGLFGTVAGVVSPTKQTSYLWKVVLVVAMIAALVLCLRCLALAKAKGTKAETARILAVEEKGRIERDRDLIAADLEKHKLAYQNAAQDLSVLELRSLFSLAEIGELMLERKPDGSTTLRASGVKVASGSRTEKQAAESKTPVLPLPAPTPAPVATADCEPSKCSPWTKGFYAAIGCLVGSLIP